MSPKTYEEGLAEGRLRGIEKAVVRNGQRINEHEKRLIVHDRLQWALMGALVLMQVIPLLQGLISK